MARNIDRDNREAERRKNQLLDAGFQLFSKYGIETVSLQKVADAADVGATTMYKYFQTKEKLLIAISAKVWGEVWQEVLMNPETDGFDSFTAYQGIAFYADLIISLYRKYPELLRFSSEYKTCIFRKNCASVPEERSAIPLETEQNPAGRLVAVIYSSISSWKFKTICLGCHSA